MSNEISIERGSGNVFADLELPDAEDRLAKATLSILIGRTIRERGLTQGQAAEILQTTQPKISDLMRGKLTSISMERLFRYLKALGMDVHIQVTPKDTADAHLEVVSSV